MKGSFVIVNLLVQLIISIITAECNDQDYWTKRAALITEEEKNSLGGNLSLDPKERLANDLLLTLKRKEIDDAFEGRAKFFPAKNFIEVRNEINKSKLFDIIKKMPKGAVLHAHDTAIVSEDWLYHNVTYRDNLYICNQAEKLQLKFFDTPTNDCDWQLLKELRKNETVATEINLRIQKEFSMMTNNPDIMYPDVNSAWNKFMSIFILITPMLTYRPVYEDHFYQGLKELYEDNILYLELRSTLPPLYELNGTQYSPIDVVRIYKEVTDRFIKDYPDFIGVKIIFAPLRIMSVSDLDEYINMTIEMKRTFPNFFAGFDLVGQEDKGNPLNLYVDKLQRLTNEVNFFFHAGETDWFGLKSDKNLLDAVLLNTTRIGHGYALLKHPQVLKIIMEKKIAIEICPISNQVLGLVRDLRNHPASILFAEGFPVVISNDDPGLWGSKALSYDFYEAFVGMMSRDADIRALKQLALNSIIYSSMSNSEKHEAAEIWTRKWHEFLDKINYSN
ncbi:adenosine deaminase 2-like [Microplitis mediator]|uniref:adenosine deaminase 2-like n=1 Tax=Microplitis mediator TaxID=375433 RepID=UPI002552F226|nr:adenosine deaminase 2-like [Microplitis mediator]XP_057325716.1 adenosine deaminase 2-like [Microplitis mediator]